MKGKSGRMPQSEPLALAEDLTIGLGRGFYHWVSVKKFVASGPLDEDQLLGALLSLVEYRDRYLGPFDDHSAQMHGPYILGSIRPADFVKMEAKDAESFVRDYAERYEAPSEALAELEGQVVAPIAGSTVVWQLLDLGDAAKNQDIGGILHDFQELVVFNKEQAHVILIVMGGD
jgi:hypothetical protein